MANEFLCSFTTVLAKKDNVDSDRDFWMIDQKNKCSEDEPLLHTALTTVEVLEAIRRLARRKAVGLDGIPGEVIKKSDKLANSLVKIFNDIWCTGKYPVGWNKSFIVPIYKKGDKKDSNNYRPITVMNALAKLYSIILTNRITKIVHKYNLIKEEQAGFMQHKNCIQQVSVLHEICARRMRLGKDTTLLFVDFSKAYDSVNHRVLFKKLGHYGIRGNLLTNIMGMYKNPSVCVRVNNVDSDEREVKCGLKQGDPTSPILFNIYINDLLDVLSKVITPAVIDDKAYTMCDCNRPNTKRYRLGTYVNRTCACPLLPTPIPERRNFCNPAVPSRSNACRRTEEVQLDAALETALADDERILPPTKRRSKSNANAMFNISTSKSRGLI